MADPGYEQPPLKQRSNSNKPHRILFIVVPVLLLAITIGLLWMVSSRLQNLEHRLGEAQRQAQQVNRQLREYSQEVDLARERAATARRQASDSEEQAKEALQGRLQAQFEKDRAQQVSEAALAETERMRESEEKARAETYTVRGQLEQIRARREAELNRMQEALSRVAPTTRTPLGMVMMLSDEAFGFDFDTSTLRPENREALSRIAGILLASGGYRLFVYGHTDDIGTDEYNQGLSERRATSVRDYLVEAGIPEEIISTRGFGKSSPLVNASSRSARSKNRRVEIGIVDTIITYDGQIVSP